MLPKSPQSSFKGLPRRVQRSIFKGFLMNLGNFFRYLWLWKLIISPKIPGIICTCWVTPSLEKYILTDFKPHVQLEFKFKNNSILHGADARPSKQQQAKAKTDFETPSVQKILYDISYVLAGWRHHLKSVYLQTSSHMSKEGRRYVRSTRNFWRFWTLKARFFDVSRGRWHGGAT